MLIFMKFTQMIWRRNMNANKNDHGNVALSKGDVMAVATANIEDKYE